jgi:hypothetical protein
MALPTQRDPNMLVVLNRVVLPLPGRPLWHLVNSSLGSSITHAGRSKIPLERNQNPVGHPDNNVRAKQVTT